MDAFSKESLLAADRGSQKTQGVKIKDSGRAESDASTRDTEQTSGEKDTWGHAGSPSSKPVVLGGAHKL